MILQSSASEITSLAEVAFDRTATDDAGAWSTALAKTSARFHTWFRAQRMEILDGVDNASSNLAFLPNDPRTAADTAKPLHRFHTVLASFSFRVLPGTCKETTVFGKEFL